MILHLKLKRLEMRKGGIKGRKKRYIVISGDFHLTYMFMLRYD